MGIIVIACYKPKLGGELALRACLAEHLPALRRLGLATERRSILMKAEDGTVIEIFEWVDDQAVARAHTHPEVLALWGRFTECCDHVPPAEAPGMTGVFPGFAPY